MYNLWYDTSLLVIISTFQSDNLYFYNNICKKYNTYTNHRINEVCQ